MKWFTSTLLALCLGLALSCDWDPVVDPDQGLDPVAMETLGVSLLGAVPLSEPTLCKNSCCSDPTCDLALIGFPADGSPQCLLVNCWLQGRDQCVFRPSSQFKVYRKKVDPQGRAAQQDGGEKPRLVALMEAQDPQVPESRYTNQTSDVICRLPVKVGSCRAAFPKFFYNVTEQSCHSFIYGGCEGNGNNFNSQDECEKTCSSVTGPLLLNDSTSPGPAVKSPRMAPVFNPEMTKDYAVHCEVEPEAGPCRAAFTRWFYNRTTGNCETFTYGGCRGNKNNYDSKESCSTTCSVSVLLPFKKPSPDDVSDDYKVHCKVEPEAGPCRAAFTRWFYNHKTGNCETFTYGGCRGNKNNYDSKESCSTACSVSFDSHGEDHHDRTAAFFLFVTLAAISALLLVAVVVVSLRRRRHSRRSSSSDKQELLPDADTCSSQESLTDLNSPDKPDKA